MKMTEFLMFQGILFDKCNSSNGTSPDENAPGWHLIDISTEDQTGHKVVVEGVEKWMYKCNDALPDVVYGLSSVAMLAPGGCATFNVDDESNTLVADADIGLFALGVNGDFLLLSFNNKEFAMEEFGLEPGTYFHTLTSNFVALAYYVPNE